MFLLASTRDLHTVRWLDNFTRPVIINNYWEEDEEEANPGVGDAFRESDKRYAASYIVYLAAACSYFCVSVQTGQ